MTRKKGKWIVLIQLMVMFYSFTGVLSKLASIQAKKHGIFTIQFASVIIAMVFVLGVYALLWQRILKHVDLSIAYANKGFGLFWTLVWSILFFGEKIKINNIVGICIIIFGIMVVTNSD